MICSDGNVTYGQAAVECDQVQPQPSSEEWLRAETLEAEYSVKLESETKDD